MSIFKGVEKSGRGPKASLKQWAFIRQLCEQTGNDDRLGDLDEDLTSKEAGELIEELLEERGELPKRPMWWDDPHWD